jgi:hypothetical protein
MTHGHESDHEQATIERLQLLVYEYMPGLYIEPENTLLHKLLSGEIRVKEAEREVGEAV